MSTTYVHFISMSCPYVGDLYLLATTLEGFFIQNRPVICHNVSQSVQKVSITWTKVAGLDLPQCSTVTAVAVMLGVAQHTAYSIQHTACSIQHAAYSMQHTACSMQHTACSIQHAAYSMQHAAYSMQHAAYSMQHTAYSMQHTAYSMQHTAYSMQHTAYSRRLSHSVAVGAQPLGKVGMEVGVFSVWPDGTQL